MIKDIEELFKSCERLSEEIDEMKADIKSNFERKLAELSKWDTVEIKRVGDFGYFWDSTRKHRGFVFGELTSINLSGMNPYICNYFDLSFDSFSKTPPQFVLNIINKHK